MKIKELKELLAKLPDDMELWVYNGNSLEPAHAFEDCIGYDPENDSWYSGDRDGLEKIHNVFVVGASGEKP